MSHKDLDLSVRNQRAPGPGRRSVAILIAAAVALSSCGYTAKDGELVGQAKKVRRVTPIVCPGYYSFDVSLGIMRNGTGSMSTNDVWLTVATERDIETLKSAVDNASVVRVHYDTRRLAICTDEYILTSVEIVKD